MAVREIDLKIAKGTVEAALASYEKQRPYNADGVTPRYTDPTQQENELERALHPLRGAVEQAQLLAEQAQAEAQRLASTANGDPAAEWSVEQLQRYSLRKPHVQTDLQNLPFPALAKRVENILNHGDEIEKTLLLELLPSTRRPNERNELSPMLTQIERSLANPKVEQAIKEAEALSKAAGELRHFAGSSLTKASGSDSFGRRASDSMYSKF